jgi:hypothetical protein
MIEFRATYHPFDDTAKIFAKTVSNEGKLMAVTCDGISITEKSPGELWPVFIDLPIDNGSMQSLFNALWDAGFRPHKGESGVAHVEALKYHLEDMRHFAYQGKPPLVPAQVGDRMEWRGVDGLNPVNEYIRTSATTPARPPAPPFRPGSVT